MKLHMVTFVLLVIGGLNWLAVGLFKWEIADLFGGQPDPISRIIYTVVGLAAVAEIVMHKKKCRDCGPNAA